MDEMALRKYVLNALSELLLTTVELEHTQGLQA